MKTMEDGFLFCFVYPPDEDIKKKKSAKISVEKKKKKSRPAGGLRGKERQVMIGTQQKQVVSSLRPYCFLRIYKQYGRESK